MAKNRESGIGHTHAGMASSTAGALADSDALSGLAKLELSELERKQARWAQARGARSMRSVSNWVPGILFALILIGGQWIASAYIDPNDRVTKYLAYGVSMLTAIVFILGWTVRILNQRLDAMMEIIEQQK